MNRHRFIGSGLPAGTLRTGEREGPRTEAATMDVAEGESANEQNGAGGCQGVENQLWRPRERLREDQCITIGLCSPEFVRAPSPNYFSSGALGQYFPGYGEVKFMARFGDSRREVARYTPATECTLMWSSAASRRQSWRTFPSRTSCSIRRRDGRTAAPAVTASMAPMSWSGDSLRLGPLAATRRACLDPE
jgi:hypothetical protein